MNDTVRDKDVSQDNLSAIDEDAVAIDGDGDIFTVQGRNAQTIFEGRAVSHGAVDHVVGEHCSQVFGRDVAKRGADGLESFVVGREYSDIGRRVNGLDEISCRQGTCNSGEI